MINPCFKVCTKHTFCHVRYSQVPEVIESEYLWGAILPTTGGYILTLGWWLSMGRKERIGKWY